MRMQLLGVAAVALALVAATAEAQPRVRKSTASLTREEQQTYIDAMFALRAKGPRNAPTGAGDPQNRYEEFVQAHDSSSSFSDDPGSIHGGPFFLPWHRQALFQMEEDVRAEGRRLGNARLANFTAPYWDWTRDPFPADLFAGGPGVPAVPNGFLGGNGDAGNGDRVATGPFAFNTMWRAFEFREAVADRRPFLRRRFSARNGAGAFTALVDPANGIAAIDAALAIPDFAVPGPNMNYRGGAMTPLADLRWLTEKAGYTHDSAHVAIGGHMGRTFAGNSDPVFWMLHAYVDAVWAKWECDRGPLYAPADTVAVATSRERFSDPMPGFKKLGGSDVRPRDVLNFLDMGYTYDYRGMVLGVAPGCKLSADACANAAAVGEGTFPYDLARATKDYAGTCGNSANAPDVWYKYVPTGSGTASVETCGLAGTNDTVLEALARCGGPTITCNDDAGGACGFRSRIMFQACAGQPILIRIAQFGGGAHAGSIRITLAAAVPPNNACANATAVGDGVFRYTTCGATTDGPSPCGSLGNDVWFRYTASCTGMATATTCSANRNYDSVIAVHTGAACAPLGALIACNDDGPPACPIPGVPFSGSTVTWAVTGGSMYLIQVGGFGVAMGSSDLTLSCTAAPAPPNNRCPNATRVREGTFSYDLSGATNDDLLSCAAVPDAGDVWFEYTPSACGLAMVTTCGLSSGDSVLEAVASCGGSSIACNDNACGLQSAIAFPVSTDVPVLLRVADSFGIAHAGLLSISVQSVSGPSNDHCASASPVGEGVHAYDLSCATNDYAGDCGLSAAAEDVWFLYTPGMSGTATVTTCGLTAADSVLEAVAGCNGPTIACDDDSCNLQSTISFGVTAGVPMLIRVAEFAGGSHAGSIMISVTDTTMPPPNDLCADAALVGDGDEYDFTNVGAGTDGPSPCGDLGSDVWFLYTAPCTGEAVVTTCSHHLGFDTVIAVYDAPCLGALLGCNNDGPPFCPHHEQHGSGSTVRFSAVAGNQYLIQVGGHNGEQGGGALVLSCGGACHGQCIADVDDGSGVGIPDGGVTAEDLFYYLLLFDQGLICADVDDGSFTGTLDGGVTIEDLLFYLARFDAGC